ncbi:adenosylcobinamide-phosphate synthase CbiB [Sphingomonas sp. NPDC079357]|uniref:adenosylcobinamide-phosphate synthase CbiB n=1 Tax=Sphingomonas sp. NPDC079357 TaxID=3364518 RepID=UPI00384AD0D7
MAEPVALAALAIDVAVGWPAWLYARVGHPVGAIARVIEVLEKWWNRRGLPRRLLGVATIAIVVVLTAVVAVLAEWGVRAVELGWVGVALLAWPGLAQRSLYAHVRPVATALVARDLPAARRAVAMIVGRDTLTLDEAGIARAAIESLAESFCDGVAAPLFWLLVGGLPGLWAYKAINTADSLIGHREERWRDFGWAAARLDDAANWIPARIGAVLICVAGGGGWRVMWRDARNHASPNAGWTEAAMAGVLGLRLAGPIAYDGVVADKPWIGDGRAAADAADVRRALAVYGRACGLLWVLAGVAAWAS